MTAWRLSFGGVLRSERVKLRSLRSSSSTLLGAAVVISTLVAVNFLIPGLGSLVLPSSWRDDVLKFLPSNASDAFTSVVARDNLLTSGAGAAVFAAWVLVPLIAAAVLLRKRNA
ncbi:hypothetical protein [Amycolatopsis sp. lyj-109]|uniref:hypothetical protein n=1 Tax=Amycolatopsis sp. lyj-109 TaxID=2789287 RepID=UPI003978E2F5